MEYLKDSGWRLKGFHDVIHGEVVVMILYLEGAKIRKIENPKFEKPIPMEDFFGFQAWDFPACSADRGFISNIF